MNEDLNPFRPVRFLDGHNQPQAVAMVPRESEYGYEPTRGDLKCCSEVGCFPEEYEALKVKGIPVAAIRIGTAENPCLRYAMFRPRAEGGGFGECVARIPWTSENYHVPGICSRYHRAIVCGLKDYRSAIERGNYEEREAIPWPEPFVATHACTFCEWRGVLSECVDGADLEPSCPSCHKKRRVFRPVYEVEYDSVESEQEDEDRVSGPEPEAAMTLRDRFALAALTGIAADGGDGSIEGSVSLAYRLADAMMKRRAES